MHSLLILLGFLTSSAWAQSTTPVPPRKDLFAQVAIDGRETHFGRVMADNKGLISLPLQLAIGKRFLLNEGLDAEARGILGLLYERFDKDEGEYQNINGDRPYLTQFMGQNMQAELGAKAQLNYYVVKRWALYAGAGLAVNYETQDIETESKRSWDGFGNHNHWDYESSRLSGRALALLGTKLALTEQLTLFLNFESSWLDPMSIRASSEDYHLSRSARYPGIDPRPYAYSGDTRRYESAILGAEYYF